MNSFVTFFYGLLYMDTQVLVDLKKRTFIYSEWTLDSAWWTFQERLVIGTNGKEESVESAPSVSKVGNHSRGRPEGSLFNRYYSEV